jgi:hypothetical protein
MYLFIDKITSSAIKIISGVHDELSPTLTVIRVHGLSVLVEEHYVRMIIPDIGHLFGEPALASDDLWRAIEPLICDEERDPGVAVVELAIVEEASPVVDADLKAKGGQALACIPPPDAGKHRIGLEGLSQEPQFALSQTWFELSPL